MHELSRIILEQEPARVDVTPDQIMILDTYDTLQVEEADWLSWSLLVPREALLSFLRGNSNEDGAASHFKVSRKLLSMRRQLTGIDRQLKWASASS